MTDSAPSSNAFDAPIPVYVVPAPKGRSTRIARRIVPFAVSIAALWWLFRDVDGLALGSLFRALAKSLWGWCALALSFAAHFGFSTLKWRDILDGLGHRQPLPRLLRLELASDLFIRIVPLRGGEAAKIWYLSVHQRIPALVTAASVAVEMVTNVGALILLAIAGHATLRWNSPMAGVAAGAMVVVGALVAGRAMLQRIRRSARVASASPGTRWKMLGHYAERAATIPRRLMARVGFLSLMIEFSEIVVVALLCRAMSIDVPIVALVALWPLVAFLGRLPISIGGVGVRDGALVALLPTLVTASYEQVLAVSLAFTLVGVLIPCFVGFPFTVQLVSAMTRSTGRPRRRPGKEATDAIGLGACHVTATADATGPPRP
ncbi:MAG: flippase-like domain-containing protein [Deltaproteobacteria bacterium]|nr:flippase-like domain-containing protein [Deltaproteobacteria bacterium]